VATPVGQVLVRLTDAFAQHLKTMFRGFRDFGVYSGQLASRFFRRSKCQVKPGKRKGSTERFQLLEASPVYCRRLDGSN
jgi:hypothetical protein